MKTSLIQKAGAGIFGSSLAVLLISLFMGSYTLDRQAFQSVVTNEDHRSLLEPELEGFFGREYNTTFAFSGDYSKALNAVNSQLKNQEKWDSVIYKDYTLDLTRAAATGIVADNNLLFFLIAFVLGSVGALLFIFPRWWTKLPGIKNDGTFFRNQTNRGWKGVMVALLLIGFYIVLYRVPEHLVNWVIMLDPLSFAIKKSAADQWFLYGFMYTMAISIMAVRMALRYLHNCYQLVRTASVTFFQVSFAFLIPQILALLNQPAYDLKSIWPLEYTFFFEYRIDEYIQSGSIGIFMLGWGIALILIGVPVFTYIYGKRWYCSWVCGCGGLAETAGDPYRHLSDKSLKAWQVERWLVHGVLVFAVVMTGMVLYTYFSGQSSILGLSSFEVRSWYGFLIGFIFAGAIGTGFYPLMGNRVWCRFGCPLAAYIGLIQRFKSRFRITTNGGQCISCGNCSTYCEMGIDVRWYAQRGQNVVRASCVGCGICAAVCPRGVLRLENKEEEGRINSDPILIGRDGAHLSPDLRG